VGFLEFEDDRLDLLNRVTLKFNEPVRGIDGSELRLNGGSAIAIDGEADTWTFQFEYADYGEVVLTWNTDHGQSGWRRIAQAIRSEHADLVCLVEAGPTDPSHERFWQAAFPDHATGNLGSGILVLVRDGTIRQVGSGSIDGNARFRQFDVSCRGERLTVLVVDVRSTPWVSRRSALEKLVRLIEPLGDQPVLITGDFNTPSDSACFDTWRTPLKNAWETAGNGFRPTWPVPLPMLDLAQCWGNRHVDFVHCRGGWSSWSDHRPLITTFTVNRPQ